MNPKMGNTTESPPKPIEPETVVIEINDSTPEGTGTPDDPVMEEPFNPAEINILTKPDTLRNIIDRLRNNEIDLNTDFQRHAELWDSVRMSRLIESILIRFPLPAFYFDATNEDKWLVVDGLQRLSTIRKFVVEENSAKRLRLRGLEYLKEFQGKIYADLPRTYQRRIDECPITLFLIQPGTPEAVKYSIFRRINTGGLVLTDQEIRNAMAKPVLREYFEKLAGDDYLKKTIGDQTKRMVDQELVLRFLAFFVMDYEKSKKNITTFLDEMVSELEKTDKQRWDYLEKTYRTAMKRSWLLFEETAFEKNTENTGNRRRRKNSTLFEVWTVALAKLSEQEFVKLVSKKGLLRQKHLELMTNDDAYFRSITYATQKRDHFRIRNDRVQNLIKGVINA